MMANLKFLQHYWPLFSIPQSQGNFRAAERDKRCRLNSHGYRGQELAEAGGFVIAAFGCEAVFGEGLDEQETFPQIVAKRISERIGKKTCVLNFGNCGGSNDSTMRLVSCSANHIKPDLVLVHFTYAARREYLRADGMLFEFDPLAKPKDFVERDLKRYLLTLANKENSLANFYRNYNGISNLLAGKRWLFSSAEEWPVEKLVNHVDRSRYVGVFPSLDSAPGTAAPGTLSHRRLAEMILSQVQLEEP